MKRRTLQAKKLRDRRTGTSPYRKYQKTEHRYRRVAQNYTQTEQKEVHSYEQDRN